MTDRRNALHRVMWDTDLIGSRVTLALAEMFWAIMLFWLGDTFDRPTYAHMASIAREEIWGTVFAISAIIQISIVLSSKMHTLGSWLFAGWNFLLWSYVVWSMMASIYPPPAAIGGEIALAFSSGWIWLRPIITSEFDGINTPWNKR